MLLGIARAIRAEGEASFMAKRCAVAHDGTTAHFWSPRNSMEPYTGVSMAVALRLADKIEAMLRPTE